MSTNVLARLTVIRQNGVRTIVEVHAGATFHRFYSYYRQQGAKRSTKEMIRTASRNEGLNPVAAHRQMPGLKTIAVRLLALQATTNPVISTKIRIMQARAYKKLINAAPDQLGLTKVSVGFAPEPAYLCTQARGISVRMITKLNHNKIHAGAR